MEKSASHANRTVAFSNFAKLSGNFESDVPTMA
jgi:hypothetical protein